MQGIYDSVPQGGGAYKTQGFLKGDEKTAILENGQPFIVIGVRRRGGQPDSPHVAARKAQWNIDIWFMDPANNTYHMVEDDEGGAIPAGRTLSMTATDYRDQVFPMLDQQIKAHQAQGDDGVGPLYLSYGPGANGTANKSVILSDTPYQRPTVNVPPFMGGGAATTSPAFAGDTPAAQAAPPPPPPSEMISPDGKWRWDGTTWLPREQPPAAPPAQPFSPAADVVTPQPIPEVETISGSDGEGGTVTTTRTKPGQKIREARYQGAGVVEQPSGVETQNVASYEGGMAQEAPSQAPPSAVPPPPPAATEAVSAKTPTTVSWTAQCVHCSKEVRSPAFKNAHGKWIMTHTCTAKNADGKTYGSMILDVDGPVRAMLGES
jgi:hypothetical protein